MIDRLREQIQERLDQLTGEIDRLRKALSALGPHPSAKPASTTRTQAAAPRRAPRPRVERAAPPEPKAPAARPGPARRTATAASPTPRRTPGATKASVLAALDGGEPMTASQVAAKTGLSPSTVATTLSRLAKSGEVQKAERGYRLPATAESTPAAASE